MTPIQDPGIELDRRRLAFCDRYHLEPKYYAPEWWLRVGRLAQREIADPHFTLYHAAFDHPDVFKRTPGHTFVTTQPYHHGSDPERQVALVHAVAEKYRLNVRPVEGSWHCPEAGSTLLVWWKKGPFPLQP